MTEITIFQLWHLFNQEKKREQRERNHKKIKNSDIHSLMAWVKRCEFSWRMDAAAGMLLNIPLHILEWGEV